MKATNRRRQRQPSTTGAPYEHPGWWFPTSIEGAITLDRSVSDGSSEGLVHYTLVNLTKPRHFERFQIPDEWRGGLILRLEDYSDWPEHRTLEVATVGVGMLDRPSDKWLAEHRGELIEFPYPPMPYILAVYQAARTRGSIGYGVIWWLPDRAGYSEQRLEGFDVRKPGFKSDDLKGAIDALQELGGINKVAGGRRRLEDKPEWRAIMQSIDEYMLKYPTATLENIVDRFGLAAMKGFNDLTDDIEAEAVGVDPWEERKAAAVAKLTRWLTRWRNFQSRSEQAEFT